MLGLGLSAAAVVGFNNIGWSPSTNPSAAALKLTPPSTELAAAGSAATNTAFVSIYEPVPSVAIEGDLSIVDDVTIDKDSKAKRKTALAKMSKAVEQLALSGGNQVVELLVTYSNIGEQSDSEVARLEQLGGEITQTYSAFPFVALQLTADELIEFASGANVQLLDLDAEVGASQYSTRRSAGAMDEEINWNYVGKGPGVAVVRVFQIIWIWKVSLLLLVQQANVRLRSQLTNTVMEHISPAL